MKILQIGYVFPPIGSIADGITTVIQNISKELSKRGHDVTVYTSNAMDLKSKNRIESRWYINKDAIKVHHTHYWFRYETFFFTPSLIPLLRKTIEDFDIIHIHDLRSFQGLIAGYFSILKKTPYVYQPHGSYLSHLPSSVKKSAIRMLVDKLASDRLVKHASKILALNKTESSLFRDTFQFHEEKIKVVPNGINLEKFQILPQKGQFKKKFGINYETKSILYLGRIHESKGIDLLVKSYANLVKNTSKKDTRLIIAGPDDGYLSYLKRLVKSSGISENVIFTGLISSQEKIAALVDSEVLVTPYFFGFPITFLEACVTGTPIVTTNKGDTLDWIHNKTGIVVPPNSQKLAEAILELITNKQKLSQFSKNCLEIIEDRFSIKKIVDDLEHLYEEVTLETS